MKSSNCSKNSSSKPSEQINNPTLAEVLLALNPTLLAPATATVAIFATVGRG